MGGPSANDGDSLATMLAMLFQIIKDNKWSIVFLTLLGTVGGIFKALSEMPVYQAALTMAVEPSSNQNSSQALFDPYAYRFYETQYELLKSRSVAEQIGRAHV